MRALVQMIFVRIYCMDMWDLLWWGVLLAAVFMALYERRKDRWWVRCLVGAALICCVVVVIYATVGNRQEKPDMQLYLTPFHTYREVMNGGSREIYRSNFMNAALFYPAGLLATVLLPQKWPGWCRCLLVVALLGGMSAGIEYVQYRYSLGLCEIDDVIHNTAGALAGSLAALGMPGLLAWLWAWLMKVWNENVTE